MEPTGGLDRGRLLRLADIAERADAHHAGGCVGARDRAGACNGGVPAYSRASFASVPEFSKLVDQLNYLMAADLPEGRFVTFVALLLDPSAERAGVISAGTGRICIMWRRRGGSWRWKRPICRWESRPGLAMHL